MIRGLFNKSIKTSVTPKKLCNKSNTSLIKQQHRNYHVSTVTRNNNASAVVNNNGNVEKDKGLVTAGVVNATASSPRVTKHHTHTLLQSSCWEYCCKLNCVMTPFL